MPRVDALSQHARAAGALGTRLQPNHPTDDRPASRPRSSTGCCYGCGDAVIGINPATDNPNVIAPADDDRRI
jgi:ethanolamine ammonia-lyase large subunit